MRLRAIVLALMVTGLVAGLAGCGRVEHRREPDLRLPTARAEPAPTLSAAAAPAVGQRRSGRMRIAVVTHGQASDPFWAVVNSGIQQASRELGVSVTYSAPDSTDMGRMRGLIREAVASRPDGLVVSVPDSRALGPAIRSAVRSGIPVVSMNSGTAAAARLGVLAHVGQPDRRAGQAAGERMARHGVRRAICVEHERDNVALEERCRGFAAALRSAGSTTDVLRIDLQDRAAAEREVARAVTERRADGMLTLGPAGAAPALEGLRKEYLTSRVKVASFDLSPEVLDALEAYRLTFAVDQQPFLQGYLPVLFLAQQGRYGVVPARGTLVPTGPSFVTRPDVDRVRRLTQRGIR